MGEDRPDKRAVRDLWLTIIEAEKEYSGPVPLYLTMPGAAGHEIGLLVERDILRVSETGAIEDPDGIRVVAVESSPNAMAELKKRFPGLSAVDSPIQDLLKGFDRTKMPEGKHRKRCQARIVNLDFNGALEAQTHRGVPVWHQLELVVKLAAIHRENPEPWFLFLTFNAHIHWAKVVQRAAVSFVRENVERWEPFRLGCERVLGKDLLSALLGGSRLPAEGDSRSRQRFMMVFVPKKIASEVGPVGWRTETVANLHYGDDVKRAAMVTWIFRFEWDERTASTPDAVYGEAVTSSVANCSELTPEGDTLAIGKLAATG